MPTAIWRSFNTNQADLGSPESSGEQPLVGVIVSGGTKSGTRRAFIGFNLAAPPDIGTAPAEGAQLVAADLLLDITILDGFTAWPGRIERITRADWYGFDQSTWQVYKRQGATPYNWTTPGGDVDAASAVAFTSPAAFGAYQTGGLLAIVQDAYANRGTLCLIRLKSDEETSSFTAHFGAAFGPTNDLRPRLQLTYAAAATIDDRDPARLAGSRPAGATAASAPGGPSGGAKPAGAARPGQPPRR
ncbi:MAG: hypothetical protein ACYDEB_03845 [Dehalococcoidia bacterium]